LKRSALQFNARLFKAAKRINDYVAVEAEPTHLLARFVALFGCG
jgi:hypothetical protein